MRRRTMLALNLCVLCVAAVIASGCVTESKDAAKRDVAGPYQTWDDVIKRWVGGQVTDLYVELGPPNLHPHQMEDGTIQMVWDFAIDRMPGQADALQTPSSVRQECQLPAPFFCGSQRQDPQGRTRGMCITPFWAQILPVPALPSPRKKFCNPS